MKKVIFSDLIINQKIKEDTKSHVEYKRKIKQNLKRIKSKKILIILFGFILLGVLFIAGDNMAGFAVSNIGMENNWNILGFICILVISIFGLLIFTYRKKIIKKIETKKRDKYPKNHLLGLIKKEVYTEEGDYLGKIKEVFLVENKIKGLKINLDKKHKVKGFIIKYNDVKDVGHIMIVDNEVFEFLEKD